MPRKGPVAKRDVLPDPIYNSKLVSRLINKMMVDGKKGTSQKILYGAFELVRERSGKDPLEVFEAALKNVMPVLEVNARRVGGANYQVPVEVRPERRTTLGLRYLVNYSRNAVRKQWKNVLRMKSLMLPTTQVHPLNVVKKCTKWQKRTKHSLTIAGKIGRSINSAFAQNFDFIRLDKVQL